MEGKPEPRFDLYAAQGDAKSVSVVVEKGEGGENNRRMLTWSGLRGLQVCMLLGALGRVRVRRRRQRRRRERCFGCGGGR